MHWDQGLGVRMYRVWVYREKDVSGSGFRAVSDSGFRVNINSCGFQFKSWKGRRVDTAPCLRMSP